MKCSVIICTRNRQSELEHCLASISRQTLLPDEVIIVDGSDTDNLSALLNDQRFNQLILIYKHTDPGLTRQRNLGIKMASGDILFFFDDDVELCEDYIEKIMEVYKKDQLGNVGGAQGMDLNIKNSFLQGKNRLLFYRLFFLSRKDKCAKMLPSGNAVHLDVASPQIRDNKDPIRIYCMSGCMMSFRRKVFNDFTFDEGFTGYSHGEDVEFSYRVSKKYNIYFSPTSKLWHNQVSSKHSWYRSKEFIYSSIKGQVYRFRKHLSNNPLNIVAILWSWIGLLIWSGIIHPCKNDYDAYRKVMCEQMPALFKPIKRDK
jgi:GT2 family glycosyltransferase